MLEAPFLGTMFSNRAACATAAAYVTHRGAFHIFQFLKLGGEGWILDDYVSMGIHGDIRGIDTQPA